MFCACRSFRSMPRAPWRVCCLITIVVLASAPVNGGTEACCVGALALGSAGVIERHGFLSRARRGGACLALGSAGVIERHMLFKAGAPSRRPLALGSAGVIERHIDHEELPRSSALLALGSTGVIERHRRNPGEELAEDGLWLWGLRASSRGAIASVLVQSSPPTLAVRSASVIERHANPSKVL